MVVNSSLIKKKKHANSQTVSILGKMMVFKITISVEEIGKNM